MDNLFIRYRDFPDTDFPSVLQIRLHVEQGIKQELIIIYLIFTKVDVDKSCFCYDKSQD